MVQPIFELYLVKDGALHPVLQVVLAISIVHGVNYALPDQGFLVTLGVAFLCFITFGVLWMYWMGDREAFRAEISPPKEKEDE